MLVNKHKYSVQNDRKLMHKVGKQWVVVSAFVLAILGAQHITTTIHANADSTSKATLDNNLINNNRNVQANQQIVNNQQTNRQGQTVATASNNQQIMQSAKALHANIISNNLMDVQQSQGRTRLLGNNRTLGAEHSTKINGYPYTSSDNAYYNPLANNDNDYAGTDHRGNQITYQTVHARNGQTYRIANDNEYQSEKNYLRGNQTNNGAVFVPTSDVRKTRFGQRGSAPADPNQPENLGSSFSIASDNSDHGIVIKGNLDNLSYYYFPLGGNFPNGTRSYQTSPWLVQGKTVSGIMSSDEQKTGLDQYEEPGTLVVYYNANGYSNLERFLSDGPIIEHASDQVKLGGPTFSDLGLIDGSILKQARIIKFSSAWVRDTSNFNEMLANDNNVRLINFGNFFNPAGDEGTNLISTAGMMKNDPNLRYVNLSCDWGDTDASNQVHYYDMQSMFKNDYSLLGVDFGDSDDLNRQEKDFGVSDHTPFTTKYVMNMQGMFMSDNNLYSLVVPSSFDTRQMNNAYLAAKQKAAKSLLFAKLIKTQNKLRIDQKHRASQVSLTSDEKQVNSAKSAFVTKIRNDTKTYKATEAQLRKDKQDDVSDHIISDDLTKRDSALKTLEAEDPSDVQSGMHGMFKHASLHYVINESSDFVMPSDNMLETTEVPVSDGHGHPVTVTKDGKTTVVTKPASLWYDVVDTSDVDLSKILTKQPTTYYTSPFKIPLILGAPLPKGQYSTRYGDFPQTHVTFALYEPTDADSILKNTLNNLHLTASDAYAFNHQAPINGVKYTYTNGGQVYLDTHGNNNGYNQTDHEEVVNSDMVKLITKYAGILLHKSVNDPETLQVGRDIANSMYNILGKMGYGSGVAMPDEPMSYFNNLSTIFSVTNLQGDTAPLSTSEQKAVNDVIKDIEPGWKDYVEPDGKINLADLFTELLRYAILYMPVQSQVGEHYYAPESSPYPNDSNDTHWGYLRGIADVGKIIDSNIPHGFVLTSDITSANKAYTLEQDTVTNDVNEYLPKMFPNLLDKIYSDLNGASSDNPIIKTAVSKFQFTNSDVVGLNNVNTILNGNKNNTLGSTNRALAFSSMVNMSDFVKKYANLIMHDDTTYADKLANDIGAMLKNQNSPTQLAINFGENFTGAQYTLNFLKQNMLTLAQSHPSDIQEIVYHNIPILLINNMFVFNELNNLRNSIRDDNQISISDQVNEENALAYEKEALAVKNGTDTKDAVAFNQAHQDGLAMLETALKDPALMSSLTQPFLNDPKFIHELLDHPDVIFDQMQSSAQLPNVSNQLYADVETVDTILASPLTQALLKMGGANALLNDPVNFKLLTYIQGIVTGFLGHKIPYDLYGSEIPISVPEGFEVYDPSDHASVITPAQRSYVNYDIKTQTKLSNSGKSVQVPIGYSDGQIEEVQPQSDHTHRIPWGHDVAMTPNGSQVTYNVIPNAKDNDVVYYYALNSDGTQTLVATYKPGLTYSIPNEAFYTNSDRMDASTYRGKAASDAIWALAKQNNPGIHINRGKTFNNYYVKKGSDYQLPPTAKPESADPRLQTVSDMNQYYRVVPLNTPNHAIEYNGGVEYNDGIHVVYLASNATAIHLHDVNDLSNGQYSDDPAINNDGLAAPKISVVTNKELSQYFNVTGGKYSAKKPDSDNGLIPHGWALASDNDNLVVKTGLDGNGNRYHYLDLNVLPLYDGMKYKYDKATNSVTFTSDITDQVPADMSNFLSTKGSLDPTGTETNSVYRKILNGKSIGFLGSSITYGWLWSGHDSGTGKSFVDDIMRDDGITKDTSTNYTPSSYVNDNYKNAVTGTTMIDPGTSPTFIERMKKYMHGPYDAFVVQLSTNDATQFRPMGTLANPSDGTNDNYHTDNILGAVEFIVKYARDHYHCPVIFYTCLDHNANTGDQHNDPTLPSKTITSGQYYGIMVQRLYQLQAKWADSPYHFQILDLYNNPSLNKMYNYGDTFIADNNGGMRMHPTAAGYLKEVPYFEQALAQALNKDVTPALIANASSVTFEPGVKLHSDADFHSMFSDDPALKSLTLANNFNTTGKTVNGMFNNDPNLQSLTINSMYTKLAPSTNVPMMYKKDANDSYTVTTPNDFTKGNVGTFLKSKAPLPNADVINFVEGNTTVKTMSLHSKINPTTGYYEPTITSSDLSAQLPRGYHLTNSTETIPFDSGTHNVDVSASRKTDTIRYHDIYSDDGLTVPASYTKTGDPSAQYTITAPTGWAIVNAKGKILNGQNNVKSDSETFNYDNATRTIDVAPVYDGLIYKYDKNAKTLEFTGGTASVNKTKNFLNTPIFGVKSGVNKSLTAVKFDSDADLSKVTDMSWMFYKDTALRSIILPSDFDTSNVTNMIHMFDNDSALASLTLPKKFSTKNVANAKMFDMFSDDSGLNQLTILSSDTKLQNSIHFHKMYQLLSDQDKAGKHYTSATANDFSQGNVGTFVSPAHAEPTDTIIYTFNGKKIGTQRITGPNTKQITKADLKIPTGYNVKSSQSLNYDGRKYYITLTTAVDTAHVFYQMSDGTPEGSTWLAGNDYQASGASDTSMHYYDGETSKLANGLNVGYHVDGNQTVEYDDKAHVVKVALNDEAVPVLYFNQHNQLVGSDVLSGKYGSSVTIPAAAPAGYTFSQDPAVQYPNGYPINATTLQADGNPGKTQPVHLNVYGNAASLVVNYLDVDNGLSQVGSFRITRNYADQPATVGDTVALPTTTNVYNYGLSSDYALDLGQAASYVLKAAANNNTNSVALDVHQVPVPDTNRDNDDRATVKIYKEDPYGMVLSDQPEVKHVIVKGDIGNPYTISAADYQPDGYDLDTSNSRDYDVTGTIGKNGITNKTATFYYQMPASAKANLKPIYVEFEDDITHKVIDQQVIQPSAADHDYVDKFVNVTANPQIIPQGYDVDSDQYTYAGFSQVSPMYIAVLVHPDASKDASVIKPITVTYYDDATGAQVGSSYQVTGAMNQVFNVSQLTAGKVPDGYTVDKNQFQTYMIGNQSVSAGILIHGKPTTEHNDTVTITIHMTDPNGSHATVETLHDVINGDVGDTYTISASDYQPSGYVPSAANPALTGTIQPDGSIDHNHVDFCYKQQVPASDDYTHVKPITVIYEDDETDGKVASDVINPTQHDYVGEPVDVATAVPAGYSLVANQETQASFGKSPLTITLMVHLNNAAAATGQKYTDVFNQIEKFYYYDRTDNQWHLFKMDVHQVPVTGVDGYASDIKAPQVPGYTFVSDGNRELPVYINGHHLSQNSAVYTFHATISSDGVANGARPIYVTYESGAQKLVSDRPVNGYMGQMVDVTDQVPVPSGYVVKNGQRTEYQIGTQANHYIIQLQGLKATNSSFVVDRILTNGMSAAPSNVLDPDNVGGHSLNIVPADYAPTGYKLDLAKSSNTPVNVTMTSTGLSPHSDTFYYEPESCTSDPEVVHPIKVNFVDDRTGKVVNPVPILINGQMDQRFTVTNFMTWITGHHGLYQLPVTYAVDRNQTADYQIGTNADNVANVMVHQKTQPGSVTINYVDSDGNLITSHPVYGMSGQPFDRCYYEQNIPGNGKYMFNGLGKNSTMSQFSANHQVVTMKLKKVSDKYGTIHVHFVNADYLSQSASNHYTDSDAQYMHPDNKTGKFIDETLTGTVGRFFDPSEYEYNTPVGTVFDHIIAGGMIADYQPGDTGNGHDLYIAVKPVEY